MNRFSARERRLIVVFAVVLVLLGVVLVVGGGGGGDLVEIPDLGIPSPEVTVPETLPRTSPTFVIPPGARDPFGGSSSGATPAA